MSGQCTAYRASDISFHLDKTDVDICTVNPDFTAQRKRLLVRNVAATKLEYGALEVTGSKASTATMHAPAAGYAYTNAGVTFETDVTGLGVVNGDGDTPTPTAFSYALGAVFGSDPTHADYQSVGSLATGTPTIDVIQESVAGRHEHASGKTPYLVAFRDANGQVQCRPVLSYLTDTITLGVNLTAAPAVNDVILGGVHFEHLEGTDFTIQGEVVGPHESMNQRALGMVGGMTFADVDMHAKPSASFTMRVAAFADLFAQTQLAQVSPIPAANGGELYIHAYDTANPQKTPKLPCKARISIEMPNAFEPLTCFNDPENGICGWLRTEAPFKVMLTLDVAETPPTGLAGAPATYRDVWRTNRSGEPHAFGIGVTYGRSQAGKGLGFYFGNLIMVAEPEYTAVGGMAAMKYTFAPRETGGSIDVRCVQF